MRYLIVDAAVHPSIIVDGNTSCDVLHGGFQIRVAFADQFCFQDAVHSFCHSIFVRISALGHTDAGMMFLQQCDIIKAALLHASVRVVNDHSIRRFLVECFLQRHYRTGEPHVITHVKADNLSAIGISDQLQVGKAFSECYKRAISYPQLMRVQGRKTLCQIRITVKEVLGVGGKHPCFSLAYQQPVFA